MSSESTETLYITGYIILDVFPNLKAFLPSSVCILGISKCRTSIDLILKLPCFLMKFNIRKEDYLE